MIKKFFITLLATGALLTSCNNDDDSIKEVTIAQRDNLDDAAIEELLDQYYFGLNGKLTKFDTIKGNEDDNNTKLKDLVVKDPAGYFYAKNPNVTASGSKIKSNKESSILISYDVKYFVSNTDENVTSKTGPIYTFGSTSEKGTAAKDPDFFFFEPTEDEAKKGVLPSHREFKNFVDGLKHFNATETNGADLYNYQGIIIIPSRYAFSRDKYYTGTTLSDAYLRDQNFIFNFELHQVTDRK